ncbi:hypothetical protein FRC17_002667 [Serendipita sp. 399]|nr:hypothetical protein FRC17_002667 [Serendipita sp. 399]
MVNLQAGKLPSKRPATVPSKRRSPRLVANVAKSSAKEILAGTKAIQTSGKLHSASRMRKQGPAQPADVESGVASDPGIAIVPLMDLDGTPDLNNVNKEYIFDERAAPVANFSKGHVTVPSQVPHTLAPGRRTKKEMEEMKTWLLELSHEPTKEELLVQAASTGRSLESITRWVEKHRSLLHQKPKLPSRSGRATRSRQPPPENDILRATVTSTEVNVGPSEEMGAAPNGPIRRNRTMRGRKPAPRPFSKAVPVAEKPLSPDDIEANRRERDKMEIAEFLVDMWRERDYDLHLHYQSPIGLLVSLRRGRVHRATLYPHLYPPPDEEDEL